MIMRTDISKRTREKCTMIVVDTIRELSHRYPLFIVSNCQCGYIEVMMKASGIEPYIKDHLCFGETRLSKDQTLLQLIERNDLKSPVYVGDTQGDADSCAKAGVPFILLNTDLVMSRMQR